MVLLTVFVMVVTVIAHWCSFGRAGRVERLAPVVFARLSYKPAAPVTGSGRVGFQGGLRGVPGTSRLESGIDLWLGSRVQLS